MDRKQFDAVVKDAIAGLPMRFRDAMRNIAIDVAERSSARRGGRRSKRLLLGLYEGVPLPERSGEELPRLPDRITLFQANIEAVCRSEAEMVEEIRTTLLHEVGHYFGLTERQLRDLGY